MVLEYNGITYRSTLADVREGRYTREGMESTYLFCVDDEFIIDATNSGNIGRFVNHSCTPNCSTRVERVAGTKRIMIYAIKDIPAGTEVTYDYKFPYEEVKIPCYCGSANCRGSLN